MISLAATTTPIPTITTSSPPDINTTPGTRSRSSSLLHRNLLTRLRPLPFQYVFSLHHTKPSTSATPTLLADTIPDIATFYKIYNNFPWDILPMRDGVHFFRSGVSPLWEDKENVDGGCWVVKVKKDDGKALRCWEELCLMVCGGELQEVVSRERDHILGISYSPRLYAAHISIWTKRGGNKKSIEALQQTILSRLSEDLRPVSEDEYYYKKHSDHLDFGNPVKEAPIHTNVEKKFELQSRCQIVSDMI